MGPAGIQDTRAGDMTAGVRRFAEADAVATREVFVEAVGIGAAARYTAAERAVWMPDPAMPVWWGTWLSDHVTLVAEMPDGRISGFMMLERDGYLNMAFVRPAAMGTGVAAALYDAILSEARGLKLAEMMVLASRFAQGFLARRGWVVVDGFAERPDLRPTPGPEGRLLNAAMRLAPLPRD